MYIVPQASLPIARIIDLVDRELSSTSIEVLIEVGLIQFEDGNR